MTPDSSRFASQSYGTSELSSPHLELAPELSNQQTHHSPCSSNFGQGSTLVRPAPLTPPDADLRSFSYAPLDVHWVRDGDLGGAGTAEGFQCAIHLYCAAWHQLPAGSLPSEESKLARLAGYGRSLKRFRTGWARGGKDGWIECDDGRLYHPILAAKVIEALKRKQARQAQSEKARSVRAARREKLSVFDDDDPNVQAVDFDEVEAAVTETKGEETKGEEEKGPNLSSSLRSDAPHDGPPRDARDALLAESVPILRRMTTRDEEGCKRFLGMLLKKADSDCGFVLSAVREVAREKPVDAFSWLNAKIAAGRETEGEKMKRAHLAYLAQEAGGLGERV